MTNCGICHRELDRMDDSLSSNCGGDCWGCVSEAEADLLGVSIDEYRKQPRHYLLLAEPL